MDLVDAMRAEFSTAKKHWRRALIAGAALYPLALAAALLSSPRWIGALGVAAFLIQIVAFVSRELSRSSYSRAEQVRRASLFQVGLGRELSPLQAASLAANIKRAKQSEPPYLGPYYEESSLRPGAERLNEIVAESSFFTRGLAQSSSWLFGGVAVAGLLLTAASVLIIMEIGLSTGAIELVGRVAAISLAFWATGDLAAAAFHYHALARSCERVYEQCDFYARSGEAVAEDVVILADEYNCALSGAPPIPSLVYKWCQNRLNAAWRGRHDDDE